MYGPHFISVINECVDLLKLYHDWGPNGTFYMATPSTPSNVLVPGFILERRDALFADITGFIHTVGSLGAKAVKAKASEVGFSWTRWCSDALLGGSKTAHRFLQRPCAWTPETVYVDGSLSPKSQNVYRVLGTGQL